MSLTSGKSHVENVTLKNGQSIVVHGELPDGSSTSLVEVTWTVRDGEAYWIARDQSADDAPVLENSWQVEEADDWYVPSTYHPVLDWCYHCWEAFEDEDMVCSFFEHYVHQRCSTDKNREHPFVWRKHDEK